jgi:CheY-like chemotaxis protein
VEQTVELTILVIDDDLDCRELLGDYLSHVGHAVVLADNGREALRLLTRGQLRPDAIVLDLAMPSMDGASFVEAIRQVEGLRRIPVSVVSAFGEAEAPSPRGTIARFLKPIDHPKLEAHLRESSRRLRWPRV